MYYLKFVAMIKEAAWKLSNFRRKIHLAASEGIPRKSFFIRNNDNLDQLLQRFWENEKFPNKTRTTEDILCE